MQRLSNEHFLISITKGLVRWEIRVVEHTEFGDDEKSYYIGSEEIAIAQYHQRKQELKDKYYPMLARSSKEKRPVIMETHSSA